MSAPEEEQGQGNVLTDNLGTADQKRLLGDIDRRMFSHIEKDDIMFLMYSKIRGKKNKTFRTIYDEYLHLAISVGGLGMRYVIRGESVRKGIANSVAEEIPERPGPLARHIWDREGEEKYQRWKRETELE